MKTLKTLFKSSLVTLVLVSGIALYATFSTEAGALTAVYLYLSRIQANLDGVTAGQEVEMILAIDTAQSINSGGSITIEFPDTEDTTWCRTAGSLTITGVTSSAADFGSGNWDIDSALPTSGSFVGACTQGGAGTVDTITITNVGALTAGNTYGVKIVSSTGKIGTNGTTGQHEVVVTAKNGTTIDSKTFELSLVGGDTVTVNAAVADVPSVTCSIATTTVDLGSLYPGGSYATANHDITTTATGSGYYWAAYGKGDGSTDAGLYKSTPTTYLLQSGGTATLDLRVVDSEGFGITLTQPSGATVSASFAAGTPGVFGTLDRTLAGAKLLLSRNSATASQSATVTYGARASSLAEAGSYSEEVTYICGGYY